MTIADSAQAEQPGDRARDTVPLYEKWRNRIRAQLTNPAPATSP